MQFKLHPLQRIKDFYSARSWIIKFAIIESFRSCTSNDLSPLPLDHAISLLSHQVPHFDPQETVLIQRLLLIFLKVPMIYLSCDASFVTKSHRLKLHMEQVFAMQP